MSNEVDKEYCNAGPPPKRKAKVRTSITLPSADVVWLKDYAEEHKLSVSAVISECIRNYRNELSK